MSSLTDKRKSSAQARNNHAKVEVFQVGKIWAVKNGTRKKVVVYTEKKSEAVKIASDLVHGNKALLEIH